MAPPPPSHDAGLPTGREDDLVGKRIASYLVEAEIGRGGMAVVYRAKDLRLDRIVALKLLAPELARNDTFRQRFTHESRVAAAIDHPTSCRCSRRARRRGCSTSRCVSSRAPICAS